MESSSLIENRDSSSLGQKNRKGRLMKTRILEVMERNTRGCSLTFTLKGRKGDH